jgi:hypothetical protein
MNGLRSLLRVYKGGRIDAGMDEADRAALKVVAEEGPTSAIDFMMTEQDVGVVTLRCDLCMDEDEIYLT